VPRNSVKQLKIGWYQSCVVQCCNYPWRLHSYALFIVYKRWLQDFLCQVAVYLSASTLFRSPSDFDRKYRLHLTIKISHSSVEHAFGIRHCAGWIGHSISRSGSSSQTESFRLQAIRIRAGLQRCHNQTQPAASEDNRVTVDFDRVLI